MLSPFVRYTILRLLAFFACLLVLSAIPWMRDNVLILLLAAATLSMLLSLFFLNGPRDEMSAKIADQVEHRMERKQEAYAKRHHGERLLSDEEIEDSGSAVAAEPEHYR